MPNEPITADEPGAEEKELCLNCMLPHEPGLHFCRDCGAPMTSYAATAPFESIFAEGHVYRQAAEKPRGWIVIAGVWLLFGVAALTGGTMLVAGGAESWLGMISGVFLSGISVAMIWKTTRNYFGRTLRRGSI